MFERLSEVEKRYEELSTKLSNPAVISRNEEYQRLSKEHSDLRDVIETFRAFKRTVQEIEGSQELLASDDPDVTAMAKEELAQLEKKKTAQEERLKYLLLPKDPNDQKNVFLEIRAGTGGDEAALFAADLLRMYLRYGERQKWKTEVLSMNQTGLKGVREVIVVIEGNGAYSRLKFEGGVHRVQRVPLTEASGRIHTSAVTVAVLPEADEVEVKIDEKELKIDVMRASGPGGQSVNTTDSAVRITHIPTGLMVVCQDEKSQHKNKAKAMRVLRSRLMDIEVDKQNAEISAARKSMVGTGDRSERIRTYNFPQNRVTDHRIGLTIHRLDGVMDGDLKEIISALQTHHATVLLEGGPVNASRV